MAQASEGGGYRQDPTAHRLHFSCTPLGAPVGARGATRRAPPAATKASAAPQTDRRNPSVRDHERSTRMLRAAAAVLPQPLRALRRSMALVNKTYVIKKAFISARCVVSRVARDTRNYLSIYPSSNTRHGGIAYILYSAETPTAGRYRRGSPKKLEGLDSLRGDASQPAALRTASSSMRTSSLASSSIEWEFPGAPWGGSGKCA